MLIAQTQERRFKPVPRHQRLLSTASVSNLDLARVVSCTTAESMFSAVPPQCKNMHREHVGLEKPNDGVAHQVCIHHLGLSPLVSYVQAWLLRSLLQLSLRILLRALGCSSCWTATTDDNNHKRAKPSKNWRPEAHSPFGARAQGNGHFGFLSHQECVKLFNRCFQRVSLHSFFIRFFNFSFQTCFGYLP